jgi:hypothetical protein
MDQDIATEILNLYKALRSTPDESLQQSIKDRIDLLIEQSHSAYRPNLIGSRHPSPPKLDG